MGHPNGELVVGFHDGSAMKIRDMETNSPPLGAGAQIKQVEEDGTEFTIRCEDGASLSLQLTDLADQTLCSRPRFLLPQLECLAMRYRRAKV
jgi:hypothetical protein